MNETLTKIATGYGGSPSITFTNIPQNYTDLVFKITGRTNYGAFSDAFRIIVNGTTIAFFNGRTINGNGTATSSSSSGPGGGGTAGTTNTYYFSNNELYIANYTSNNYKTALISSVVENPATAGYVDNACYVIPNTSPITSFTFYPGLGSSINSSSIITLYGIKNSTLSLGGSLKGTGGIISYDGTYVYHTFLNSDTFVPTSRLVADVLVLAGGGGGGRSDRAGGGGGAGGLVLSTFQTLTPGTTYTCTIGSGGAASTGSTNAGTAGVDSQFGSITAATGGGYGGGGNGSSGTGNGGSGGSGGGCAHAGNTGGSAVLGNNSLYSYVDHFLDGYNSFNLRSYYDPYWSSFNSTWTTPMLAATTSDSIMLDLGSTSPATAQVSVGQTLTFGGGMFGSSYQTTIQYIVPYQLDSVYGDYIPTWVFTSNPKPISVPNTFYKYGYSFNISSQPTSVIVSQGSNGGTGGNYAGDRNFGGGGGGFYFPGNGGGAYTSTSGYVLSNTGGKGGDGTPNYSNWLSVVGVGENVAGTYYIAGGGGGAGVYGNLNQATGGAGGGGYGAAVNNTTVLANATNAASYTGGGGGGGTGSSNGNATAGNGGSGVIIVRYKA
jgi:hypothetical protein